MKISITVFRITLFITFQSAMYKVITYYISLEMNEKKKNCATFFSNEKQWSVLNSISALSTKIKTFQLTCLTTYISSKFLDKFHFVSSFCMLERALNYCGVVSVQQEKFSIKL